MTNRMNDIQYKYASDIIDNIITKETMQTGILYITEFSNIDNINDYEFNIDNLFLFPNLSKLTDEFKESDNYKNFMKTLSILIKPQEMVNTNNFNEIFILINISEEHMHKFNTNLLTRSSCDNIINTLDQFKKTFKSYCYSTFQCITNIFDISINTLYDNYYKELNDDVECNIDMFGTYYCVISTLYYFLKLECNKNEDLSFMKNEVLSYCVNKNKKFENNPLYDFFSEKYKTIELPTVII